MAEEGGVTYGGIRTEKSLGFQPTLPKSNTFEVSSVGGDVQVEVAEAEEYNRLLQTYEDLEIDHAKIQEENDRLHDMIVKLAGALRGDHESSAIEEIMAEADALLAGSALATPTKPCPECMQGKHVNCTHEVLGDDDVTMVPCACEQQGHGE